MDIKDWYNENSKTQIKKMRKVPEDGNTTHARGPLGLIL